MVTDRGRRAFLRAAVAGAALSAVAVAASADNPPSPVTPARGAVDAGKLGVDGVPNPETDGFEYECIEPQVPTSRMGLIRVGAFTDDGRPSIVIGGAGSRSRLWVNGTRTNFRDADWLQYQTGLKGPDLFWYERTDDGWKRHAMRPRRIGNDHVPMGEGSALIDLDGDGRDDLIDAGPIHFHGFSWYRQPEDPTDAWERFVVMDDYTTIHDIAVGDVDGDGEDELVGLAQHDSTLFYYDIPDDPTVSPWPEANRHIVMTGINTKGLLVLDIDGDGRNEILAGNSIYSLETGTDGPQWQRDDFTEGYEHPRLAVADLDGDGDLEIAITEGDLPAHGDRDGRLAWFDRSVDEATGETTWTEHVLRDDLFCPHTLEIADFDGDGTPDIFVGEMGLGIHPDPELTIFLNRGDAVFEQRVISRGVPTHEARVVDIDGDGKPDIVGKPYAPGRHVDVWYNRL